MSAKSRLSVIAIAMLAGTLTTSPSVAVNWAEYRFKLLTLAAGVSVPTLDTVPVAFAATVQCSVYVTLAFTARSTRWLMLPEPDAGQVAPPAPVQVQVQFVRDEGNVSVMVVPGAGLQAFRPETGSVAFFTIIV